ncbi:MAG: gliding motility-associated C-terminal domain-containing protein, partial [Bacteroidia bacterium]|nr:gliding motility-associated C-terminal domain-containing protein [Bacteroidia bacterium]
IVQNPSNAFESAGSYSVTLTVTAANGCTNSATVTNMIQVLAVPQADFVYAPELISITAPTVSFNTTSTNATSWTWNFDDLYASSQANTSNAPNPNYTYSEVGEYCVKLIVSNQNMCFDSIVHCLDIKPDYTFFIPNAFTPNGSGLNDVFKPKGENIVEFTMRIFDRWGNEVFTSTNMNDGWDGRVKGKGQIAQVDVYAYIIEIKDTIGEYHKYIGHVTIVK